MSKTLLAAKRRIALIAVGGSVFALLGAGFPGLSSCAQNRDIVTLYQAAGNGSIEAFSDGVLNDDVDDSDYDAIVREPVTDFFQALWSNWVWMQFPRDPSDSDVAVE